MLQKEHGCISRKHLLCTAVNAKGAGSGTRFPPGQLLTFQGHTSNMQLTLPVLHIRLPSRDLSQWTRLEWSCPHRMLKNAPCLDLPDRQAYRYKSIYLRGASFALFGQ